MWRKGMHNKPCHKWFSSLYTKIAGTETAFHIRKMALTHKCTKLYKEYVKSRKQLQFSQRVQRVLRFLKERSFEKLTEKMNPLAKKMLWMQIRQCTNKTKGRRST